MEDTNIATKIKTLRKEKNMTQEDLSTKSGISISTIKKYETGNRKPKYEQLSKIASALGITTNTFFDSDVNSIGDIISLIIKLDKNTVINWSGEKDQNGQYIADSICLSFENSEINKVLASYLTNKENQDSESENNYINDCSLLIDGFELKIEKSK